MMQHSLRSALPTAIVAAFAAPATANHSAAVSSSTQYVAQWSYVPDIDQRRALLPGAGGMYCVPTSAMNWMVYIAHHGHPSVAPGDAPYWSWIQPASYNPMTTLLTTMGALMGTHETDGTSGDGAVAGLNAWLAGKGFIVYHFWTHGNTTIRFQDIADWTIAGIPVMPVVGWYTGAGTVIDRSGGHVLSVTEVARNGSQRQISWRDPADDNTTSSQSLFVSQSYALDPRTVYTKGALRIMDKVVEYGSGYIDGFIAIVPIGGLTTADDGLNLVFLKPSKFSWDSSKVLQIFNTNLNRPIRDLKLIPGSPDGLMLTDPDPGTSDAAVHRVNQAANEVTLVGHVPGGESFTFGRHRNVYFTNNDGGVMCYPLSDDIPWDVEASVYPPDPVDTLTYDDATDTVLALSRGGDVVYRYAKDLADDPEVIVFPPDPIYPWDTDAPASIAVSPLDGSLFITNEIATSVLHVMNPGTMRAASELIADGELINPRCVHVADDGSFFVVSDNALRHYRIDSGLWSEDLTSPFSAMPVGSCVDIPHSRNNFDPAEMPLEEFRNVLPTDFAFTPTPCPADLNGDAIVGGEDLATLLASWNESNDLTDLNGDGTTDGADLAVLLASWGACP